MFCRPLKAVAKVATVVALISKLSSCGIPKTALHTIYIYILYIYICYIYIYIYLFISLLHNLNEPFLHVNTVSAIGLNGVFLIRYLVSSEYKTVILHTRKETTWTEYLDIREKNEHWRFRISCIKANVSLQY